jgi:hypothetical protein
VRPECRVELPSRAIIDRHSRTLAGQFRGALECLQEVAAHPTAAILVRPDTTDGAVEFGTGSPLVLGTVRRLS